MQIKYLVATVASLAVATNAMPAPSAQLAELGSQSADAIKQLEDTYSEKLSEAAQRNYKDDNAKIPTIEEIEKLKQFAEEQKNGKHGAVDRRDPQWGWNNWNAQLNGGWNNWRVRNNFNFAWGWQHRYPFWNNGRLWNYNLNNFYTGYGLYQNCGWGGVGGWC
ncbi:hypothetical protein HII31_06975 [Pseudocercospora fuligena]|uniref:Uncharacterized protein n=1 Tax=Pseudocercospora fuligena TaxID=685502 RepID=A0A8H6VGH1_9PEZI|nr:hypothetical protein HII31_06975 [Pseudocercospora fuligena]